MAVLDKINIIDTSIDSMKEALSLPSSASLEEVVAAIGQGSIQEPTNIYRVTSEEEKNSLTGMVEDDICIVYADEKIRSDGTTPLPYTVLYFPETIDIQDVYGRISSEESCGMGVGGLTANKVMFKVGPSYFTVTEVSSSEVIANYTSSDGRVYTRTTERTTYDAGINLRPGFLAHLDMPLYYFIYMQNMTFGLYQYKENQWEYLTIGVDPNLDTILDSTTVYTDNGFVSGTRSEQDYRKDNVYYQYEEPENKTGLWVQSAEGSEPQTTRHLLHITTSELDDINKATRIENFVQGGTLALDGASPAYRTCPVMHINFLGKDFNGYIIGDYIYAFPYANGSACYKIHLGTGAYESIANFPFEDNTRAYYAGHYHKEKIMLVSVRDSSTERTLVTYDIASNSWTTMELTASAFEFDITQVGVYFVGDYIFYYATENGSGSTLKTCYRASLADPLTAVYLDLPEDTYGRLWKGNMTTDYHVDSRDRLWCYGVCYDGYSLERLTPGTGTTGMGWTSTSNKIVGTIEENNTITFFMEYNRDFTVICVSYNMDTLSVINSGTVTVRPESMPTAIASSSNKSGPIYMICALHNRDLVWIGGQIWNSSNTPVYDKYYISFDSLEFIPRQSALVIQTQPLNMSKIVCEIAKDTKISVKDVCEVTVLTSSSTLTKLENVYLGDGSQWHQLNRGE